MTILVNIFFIIVIFTFFFIGLPIAWKEWKEINGSIKRLDDYENFKSVPWNTGIEQPADDDHSGSSEGIQ